MSKQGKTAAVTKTTILDMKKRGEKISMLTAYDYSTAAMMDEVGIDMILVGDSLGMVVLGYDSTLPVTMEDMIHHTCAVTRGATRCMVIADMPFMSYQTSAKSALTNAGRFMKEAGAHGVKLEGGREIIEAVQRMTASGIPVVGHLGLTPQSIHQMGGFRMQGKTEEAAQRIKEDALLLQEAGAFAVVLEAVPAALAGEISDSLAIPTIGIGAGPNCDGQVLVVNDLLGIYERFTPKFVKKYADIGNTMKSAFRDYIDEVKERTFPGPEHYS